MNEKQVIELVRSEVTRAGSMRALGREWGVNVAYISDLLNGRRGPGPKILAPLGLERIKTVTFEKRATCAQR